MNNLLKIALDVEGADLKNVAARLGLLEDPVEILHFRKSF